MVPVAARPSATAPPSSRFQCLSAPPMCPPLVPPGERPCRGPWGEGAWEPLGGACSPVGLLDLSFPPPARRCRSRPVQTPPPPHTLLPRPSALATAHAGRPSAWTFRCRWPHCWRAAGTKTRRTGHQCRRCVFQPNIQNSRPRWVATASRAAAPRCCAEPGQVCGNLTGGLQGNTTEACGKPDGGLRGNLTQACVKLDGGLRETRRRPAGTRRRPAGGRKGGSREASGRPAIAGALSTARRALLAVHGHVPRGRALAERCGLVQLLRLPNV
eukprot:364222-Chlamydomonas_euryale.AAC.5